jgi:hypothetical protein
MDKHEKKNNELYGIYNENLLTKGIKFEIF